MSAASVEIREDITIQGFELERHKEKLRDHDARLDDIISQLTNKAEKIELLTQKLEKSIDQVEERLNEKNKETQSLLLSKLSDQDRRLASNIDEAGSVLIVNLVAAAIAALASFSTMTTLVESKVLPAWCATTGEHMRHDSVQCNVVGQSFGAVVKPKS
mmetsp:Transcript_64848/g.204764  ORF Transcript_64848/g.204764 Transcript_64848/m.204764 type:complete len:159 (+) Transcript_64848:3424-3900(+)